MEATRHGLPTFCRLPSTLAVTVVGVLAITLALFARRLAGAYDAPLPAPLLVAAAGFLIVVAWTVRLMNDQGFRSFFWETFPNRCPQPSGKGPDPLFGRWYSWGFFSASLLAMGAFSWPMARVIDWIVWVPILLGEAGFWWMHHGAGYFFQREPTTAAGNRQKRDRDTRWLLHPKDRVLQKLTRIRDATGDESLFGTLCAEFMPNERTAILHVAFCPAWMVAPHVHAEQSSGPKAAIRITQVFPHGARIEVRLAQPLPEPTAVAIDFAAMPTRGHPSHARPAE